MAQISLTRLLTRGRNGLLNLPLVRPAFGGSHNRCLTYNVRVRVLNPGGPSVVLRGPVRESHFSGLTQQVGRQMLDSFHGRRGHVFHSPQGEGGFFILH